MARATIAIASSAADREAALEIRQQVFVTEQGIPSELDDDGEDERATHVLATIDRQPVATGRLVVGDGGTGTLARIAVLASHRGDGLGRQVVRALEDTARKAGLVAVELHPHEYLEPFYESLGYRAEGASHRVGRYRLITMRRSL